METAKPSNQQKKFSRRKEDFICSNCGRKVTGNGYTDHCSACLWSRHVDINPGDRAASCGGMMEPIGIEIENGKNIIHYRCQKCGFQHRVKALPDDNQEIIIDLSAISVNERKDS